MNDPKVKDAIWNMSISKTICSAVLASSAIVLASCAHGPHAGDTYANPVIPGAIPDPSVIRVGDTYYAAGTSFDFAPNYPLYESNDLVNWTHIGAVFREPPPWSRDNFWAPELFYKNGIFYVYYTTKRRDTGIACIGVATTPDIHQGFTDHGIIIEWGEEAIDAFVFDDDDGTSYITWKAYGLTRGREIEILISELSEDGLRLVGDPFTLTDHTQGWQGGGDEGQCLVKHEGYYYLFYSIGGCCDNRCDYRVRVSRSKDLRSGWQQHPEPILHGGDRWRCPGHGTLVTTPDHRFFYLYHAYHAVDFEYVGRQGMLDEVLWDEQTGWPYFSNGGTPSERADVPFAGTQQKRTLHDTFSSARKLASMEWDIHIPKPVAALVDGQLSITPAHTGLSFLGVRPKTGDYSFEAEIVLSDSAGGIGIYTHQDKSLALMADRAGLALVQLQGGERTVLAREAIRERESVALKYEALDGRYFRFYWSDDGTDWSPIATQDNGQVDGTFLAQWGYSPRVGFLIDGHASAASQFNNATIHYTYESDDPTKPVSER